MFPTINAEKTGENLRRIMKERGITVKQVQQYLGLGSVQSIYHWLNGISFPTLDNLYALSVLFDLSMDELVCGNKEEVEREKKKDNSVGEEYSFLGRVPDKYVA